ncbi:MAG: response regulator [Brevundimonas sp.]|uniref:ATP-binding protein n=1 Tax=Brevundimonas sp. TaxID=1871086 RepID=UPI00273421AC|nr:ATP-binding protein [Brevundimonas sp.]MDP3403132.1 response regulator [Brevundimonas sp.]
MTAIVNSLVVQHDWRLMLLAIAVCAAGLATCIALINMAARSSPRKKILLAVSASLVGGLAVWAAEFLGMLSYRSDSVTRYSTNEILISLAVVVLGFGAAIGLYLYGRGRHALLLGNLVAFLGIAAMHFVGMAALRVEGGLLVWNGPIVAATVLVGMACGVCSAVWSRRQARWRIPLNTTLAMLSVFVLHFGAMSAVVIAPHHTAAFTADEISGSGLLVWVVGGATLVVGMAAIVTGLRLWGRATSLNQLREAIDTMPDGLGFYDADDRLLIWNARYAEVNPEVSASLNVGVRFRDLLQLGVEQGVYEDAIGREKEWIEERLTARRRLSSSVEQKIAGGRWLRVQDRRTAEGGIVTVVNDITELKQDAEALALARDAAEAANRAKSEFLANMSHEIRTPLNGVIGLTQALARTDLAADQREMLELIQSSGRTLQVLLSDILDLARVESGRLELADEPFDLSRAVYDAAQLYAAPARDKGLQFFVEVDPAAAIWVRGDVVRLKQVLTNLVSNAVKFTAAGFVSLTASVGTGPTGQALLRFTVEDTGVGFDGAAKARLFTRFEQADGTITRRFGGTGLGLSICRQLAALMQGELDCESEPGGGSAFILTLPLLAAEAPAVVEPSADVVIDPGAPRLKVLIADDHPTNRKVVELILAQAPVDVVSVEDGAQALEACRSQTFDLVLMDMQMPVMDGLTAVREIRLHEAAHGLPRAPIVMLTANALPDHIAAGQAAGADRHLSKPFDAAALLSLVADPAGVGRSMAA